MCFFTAKRCFFKTSSPIFAAKKLPIFFGFAEGKPALPWTTSAWGATRGGNEDHLWIFQKKHVKRFGSDTSWCERKGVMNGAIGLPKIPNHNRERWTELPPGFYPHLRTFWWFVWDPIFWRGWNLRENMLLVSTFEGFLLKIVDFLGLVII